MRIAPSIQGTEPERQQLAQWARGRRGGGETGTDYPVGGGRGPMSRAAKSRNSRARRICSSASSADKPGPRS